MSLRSTSDTWRATRRRPGALRSLIGVPVVSRPSRPRAVIGAVVVVAVNGQPSPVGSAPVLAARAPGGRGAGRWR